MKKRSIASIDFDVFLGKKIKACRHSFGYSQEQLVAKLQLVGVDIVQQQIAKIEKGLRPVYPFELLAFVAVLRMDLEGFLSAFAPLCAYTSPTAFAGTYSADFSS